MISKIKRIKHKFDAIFEKDRDSFLSQISGLIHVGANTGQERFRYWKHGLHVLWIEPIPEVLTVLTSNLKGFPRQRALPYLVTDKEDGEYQFHVASNNGESSSILDLGAHKEAFPDIAYTRTVVLRSTTLASIVRKECPVPRRYNALVLDTQGSELLVLQGAVPVLRQFLYVKTEAWEFESYTGCCQIGDITAFMADHGFAEHYRRIALTCAQGKSYDVVFRRNADAR